MAVVEAFEVALSLGDDEVGAFEVSAELWGGAGGDDSGETEAVVDDGESVESGGGEFAAGDVVGGGAASDGEGDLVAEEVDEEAVEDGLAAVVEEIEDGVGVSDAPLELLEGVSVDGLVEGVPDDGERVVEVEVAVDAEVEDVAGDGESDSGLEGVGVPAWEPVEMAPELPGELGGVVLEGAVGERLGSALARRARMSWSARRRCSSVAFQALRSWPECRVRQVRQSQWVRMGRVRW